MDQLTLTGATLIDRTKPARGVEMKKGTMVEMTGQERDHDHHAAHASHASNSSHSSHDHSAHSHSNSHSDSHGHVHDHSGGGADCCPVPKVPQVRVVYTPPSKEELEKATPQEMRMSLETLIRLGGYEETFEPLLTVILDNRPDAYDSVLNALGEDHYSLLHWAAKRSTYYWWLFINTCY